VTRRPTLLALLALAACRPGAPARERGADARTTPAADSIVARGPRGVPADRFPAPTRPVSRIVAPRWSDEDARDDAGETERVFRAAGIAAGTRVADIGAGDGYYTVRVAPRVGAAGVVYAQDIEARYLGLLQRRLRDRPQPNVVLALGEPHDPRLPRAAVDAVLMIHMYHEIAQPFGLLHNLHPALRPGARVVILDTTRPTSQHGTPPALLRCELRAMGYRETAFDQYQADEYVAVFAPPSAAALTPPDSVTARLAALGCDREAR
jgi:SAM-dependent methyltransferase